LLPARSPSPARAEATLADRPSARAAQQGDAAWWAERWVDCLEPPPDAELRAERLARAGLSHGEKKNLPLDGA